MTGSQSAAKASSAILEYVQPYMVHQARRTLRVIESLAGSLRNGSAEVETTTGDTGTRTIMGDHPERPEVEWNPNRINVRWGHSTTGSTEHVFLAAQWLRSSLTLEFHDIMPHPVMVPTKEDPFVSLDAIVAGFRSLMDAPQGAVGSHQDVALSLMDRADVDASGWVELHMPSPFGPAWIWTEDKTVTLSDAGLPACGRITASTYGTGWWPGPGFSAQSYFRTKRESIVGRGVRPTAKAA